MLGSKEYGIDSRVKLICSFVIFFLFFIILLVLGHIGIFDRFSRFFITDSFYILSHQNMGELLILWCNLVVDKRKQIKVNRPWSKI